jgi:hypothetical protein
VTRSIDGITSLQMAPCSTGADLAAAADFRSRVFRERSGLGFDEAAEREMDRSAILVGMLWREGELVSTARAIPFPSPHSPLSEKPIESHGADSEVGRLAAAPGPDSVWNALLVLTLGALWITEHAGTDTYVSYVNRKLVPLYTELGAFDTGQRCAIPGRSGQYHLVVGTYRECHRLGMERLDLSHRDAVDAITP